jgi:hypothetical protein
MEVSILPEPARQKFDYRMTHSAMSRRGETFPFAATTAAARNPRYDKENRNNQDAVGLCIAPDVVVGVVCDGCGSTHPTIEQHSVSSNEVGAKLACSLILHEAEKAFARKKAFSAPQLVESLSRSLERSFKKTLRAFCGRDESKAETFVYDFLMTTVVGFIVTREQFVVFHSGDGVIAVNGEFSVLDGEAGSYFGNDLLSMCCPTGFPKAATGNPLKVYASGEAKDLQSIFIATDGMAQLVKQYSQQMSEFVKRASPREQCGDGFDFALPEFRREIAWNPKTSMELTDDASFALIRRISELVEAPC